MYKCNKCDFTSDSKRVIEVHYQAIHEPQTIAIKKPTYVPNPKAKDGWRFYIYTKRFPDQKVSYTEKSAVEEIMLGDYGENSESYGEFGIVWYNLGTRNTPRIEAFNDSWKTLILFQFVIKQLIGLGEYPSVEQVTKVLIKNGFDDQTYKDRI